MNICDTILNGKYSEYFPNIDKWNYIYIDVNSYNQHKYKKNNEDIIIKLLELATYNIFKLCNISDYQSNGNYNSSSNIIKIDMTICENIIYDYKNHFMAFFKIDMIDKIIKNFENIDKKEELYFLLFKQIIYSNNNSYINRNLYKHINKIIELYITNRSFYYLEKIYNLILLNDKNIENLSIYLNDTICESFSKTLKTCLINFKKYQLTEFINLKDAKLFKIGNDISIGIIGDKIYLLI
jgi:hypothetical protein